MSKEFINKKTGQKYKYPYTPREYFSAVCFSEAILDSGNDFQTAIERSANYYKKDPEKLRKYVLARAEVDKRDLGNTQLSLPTTPLLAETKPITPQSQSYCILGRDLSDDMMSREYIVVASENAATMMAKPNVYLIESDIPSMEEAQRMANIARKTWNSRPSAGGMA